MKRTRILTLVLMILLSLACVLTASCTNGKDPDKETTAGGDPSAQPGPEVGTYYYEADGGEYLILLNRGDKFSFSFGNEQISGGYTKVGSAFIFRNTEGEEVATASLENDILTVIYKDATLPFSKKVDRTVSFDSNGGSAVSAVVTVLNGKSVKNDDKPADPTRDGHVFAGWYTDKDATTAFRFGVTLVTKDTTLYARWIAVNPGQPVYTISFVTGVDGLTYEDAKTVGGYLIDTPVPTKAGETFLGWWFNVDNDAENLVNRYTENTVFTRNITLYAKWAPAGGSENGRVATPVAWLEGTTVKWDAVSGANGYDVSVKDKKGNTLASKTLQETSWVIEKLDGAEAGEYIVTVVATTSSGKGDSEPAELVLRYKMLSKVSVFSVLDFATFRFEPVEHAQTYKIVISCEAHDSHEINNNASTTYNFESCGMREEGITFKVIAEAEGYISSESETYTYFRRLGTLSGLMVDADHNATWTAVPNAEKYLITVTSGEQTVHAEVTGNSYSLREINAGEGVKVTVQAVANGYISPAAAEYQYNKTIPASPAKPTLSGNTLAWNAVAGMTGYEIRINDQIIQVTGTEVDLTTVSGVEWVKGRDYSVSVRATGTTGTSLWSEATPVKCGEMDDSLVYQNGKLTWSNVLGATGYEIKINNGEWVAVQNTVNESEITFDKEGVNTVTVRARIGADISNEVSVNVTAYKVSFNSGTVQGVQDVYLATGDRIPFPTFERSGYTFIAWYDNAEGAEGDGTQFKDTVFTGNKALTVYAYYTPNSYNVTLNVNSDYATGANAAQVTYNSNYTLPVPTVTNPAYVFIGYYSDTDGRGVQYTNNEGKSVAAWNEADDVTAYAYFLEAFTFTEVDAGTNHSSYQVAMKDDATIKTQLINLRVPASYNDKPVTVVGGYAFQNCTKMTKIDIPNTVTVLDTTAFSGCNQLTAINIYSVEGDHIPVFESSDGVLIFQNEITNAKELYWLPAEKTGEFEIPVGVETLPLRAFASSKLSKVTIPYTVKQIDERAFYSCNLLKEVVFGATPAGVEPVSLSIAEKAFYQCKLLTNITIPARLSTFKKVAFMDCPALSSITVEEGSAFFKSMDGIVYSADGVKLVLCPDAKIGVINIPMGTTVIGEGAFMNCEKIFQVTIGRWVTTIENNAFYNCKGLNKVIFKGGEAEEVTIGNMAFYKNDALTEVVFEEGSKVTSIGMQAFYACAQLANLTIPGSVTTIGDSAFAYCAGIKALTFAAGEEKLVIGDSAFLGCSNINRVDIPVRVDEIGGGAFSECSSMAEIKVAAESKKYKDVNGILFNIDETEILFYPQGRIGEYTLPDSIGTINKGVFSGNRGITKLTIGKNVDTIGANAFENCVALREVVFAESELTTLKIGANAFKGCVSLSKIELPKRCTKISGNMFNGCSSLTTLDLSGIQTIDANGLQNMSALKNVTFAEGLTSIGNLAFSGDSALAEVTLPSSLQTIGTNAFQNCYSLKAIIIPKSVTSIGYGAFKNCYSLTTLTFEKGGTEDLIIGAPQNPNAAESTAYRMCGEAFWNCYNLKEVEIPARATKINNYSFAECYNLGKVTFEEGSRLQLIGYYAFAKCYSLKEIIIPNTATIIQREAFISCYSLETVTFAPGGTEPVVIGAEGSNPSSSTYNIGSTFKDCYSLKSVQFPTNLAAVADATFANCYSLESVELPNTVANHKYTRLAAAKQDQPAIGFGCFENCTGLKSFKIADGGTDALSLGGTKLFSGCVALESVYLPANLTDYKDGYNAFGVQSNATTAKNIFTNCEKLTAFTIAAGSGTTVQNGVIYNTGATNVIAVLPAVATGDIVLADTVVTIDSFAFYNCKNVTTVTVPAATTTINTKAFSGAGVQEIRFAEGSKLETIAASVFEMSGLKTFTFPEKVTKLNATLFANCENLTTVTLNEKISALGTAFSNNSSISTLSIPEGNQTLSSENGVIYNKDKTTLMLYPVGRAGTMNIPDTVKIIAQNAFYQSAVQTVVFGENTALTTISANAFQGSKLTSIEIPASVTNIANNAFRQCAELKTVRFAENGKLTTLGNYVFSEAAIESIVIPETVTQIGTYLFSGTPSNPNTTLKSAVLPSNSSIKIIPAQTFSYCTALTSFTVSKNITKIGQNAFSHTDSLKDVTFEEGSSLSIIENMAFQASGITRIVLPETVSMLGTSTTSAGQIFGSSPNLEYVELSPAMTAVYKYAFQNCTSLKTVVFHSGLTKIEQYAFSGCDLLEVDLPDTITSIGANSFEKNPNLTSVKLPLNPAFTSVPNYMFRECTSLESIDIPDSITGISAYAFDGCTSLRSVNIPAGVKTIAKYSFNNASSLENVTIEPGVTQIEEAAFGNCTSLKSIEIPETVRYLGTASVLINPFGGCSNLTEIKLSANNPYFKVYNGALYDLTLTTLVCYPGALAGDPVFPESLYNISQYAMSGLSKAENVTIPATVTTIGTYAFTQSSSLKNVKFECTLTTIPNYLFQNCTALQSVQLPASVSTIGTYVFDGCTSLEGIHIPDGVSSIGDCTFRNSGLKQISLPDSISALGYTMFQDCTQLVSVKLPGNLAKLNSYMFDGCINLPYVELPDTLVCMGGYIFRGCTAMKSIELPENVMVVGVYNFGGWTESQTVTINASATIRDRWSKGWNNDCSAKFVYPENTPAQGA